MKPKDDFLTLDENESRIFFSLMRNSCEFPKLDEVDKRLLAWFILASPGRIISWVDYLACDYRKRKSIKIDPNRLLGELQLPLGEI